MTPYRSLSLLVIGLPLVAADADPNAKDKRGTTALMQAAAFGSDEEVKSLLDKGAQVNAQNSLGQTALLLAVNQPAKVRMLLDKGADPNLATRFGRTPLLNAAAQNGNIAVVRMLLEKGASIKAADAIGTDALMLAAAANDLPTVELLLEQGLQAKAANKAGATPLMSAVSNGNLAMVKLLLARGANPNAFNTFSGAVKFGPIALTRLTPLSLAAPHSSPEVLSALIDAGAGVNAIDVRGMTPLMLAVASERQDQATLKLLLDKGAEVNLKSKDGETALAWALKFNNPATIAALKKAGAVTSAQLPPAPPRPAEPVPVRTAVVRGVAILQSSGSEFFRQAGCTACHHVNLTAISVATARNHSVPVDEASASEQLKAVKFEWARQQMGLLERQDGPANADIQMHALHGMAAEKYPADEITDAMAFNIAAQQMSNGSWSLRGISRSPIEEGDIARTALGIHALTRYPIKGRAAEFKQRVSRAVGYLRSANAQTADDHAMRLLGLHYAGEPTGTAAKALLAMQRNDGGWAGSKYLESDPFATGQSLYALSLSGHAARNRKAMRRGIDFLCRTQQPDGSWFMRSRAPKFQPYFESGFPYSHDQWISNAATAWASAALAMSIEPQSARR